MLHLLVHRLRDRLTPSIQELAIVHRDKGETKLLCKRRHRVVFDSMNKRLSKFHRVCGGTEEAGVSVVVSATIAESVMASQPRSLV